MGRSNTASQPASVSEPTDSKVNIYFFILFYHLKV